MSDQIDVSDYRKAKHPIEDLFVERWSPRALTSEVSQDELNTLFEAARWAPSSYNGQPWRFVYAWKGTPHWAPFLDLLVDFNKLWASNAAVLIIILSRKTFEDSGKAAPTHSFDTGAAWQNLALQAASSGLAAHAMQGFDYQAAALLLDLPDEFEVEAMAAVGRPDSKSSLPERLREREEPSGRKPIEEIAYEGNLPR